jgi:excisionase family DNA binding protein
MATNSKLEDFWKNEWLTAKEVAAHLRVSRITIWRWCNLGVIPAFRIGHSWRIRREDLQNFIASGRQLEQELSGVSNPAMSEGLFSPQKHQGP